jgi:hypothetical protein
VHLLSLSHRWARSAMGGGRTRSLLPQPMWRPGGLDTISWPGGCPRAWDSATSAMAPCGTSGRGAGSYARGAVAWGWVVSRPSRHHPSGATLYVHRRTHHREPRKAFRLLGVASGQAATTTVLSTTPALRAVLEGCEGPGSSTTLWHRPYAALRAVPAFPLWRSASLCRLEGNCTSQAPAYSTPTLVLGHFVCCHTHRSPAGLLRCTSPNRSDRGVLKYIGCVKSADVRENTHDHVR